MRKVAAYALFATLDSHPTARTRFEAASDLIQKWKDSKGALRSAEGRTEMLFHDGRVAEYSHSRFQSGARIVDEQILLEPSNEALVKTQISLGLDGSEVVVYVELQAAGGAYQLGPMRVDIRCPGIVRDLVDAFDDWKVGTSPVCATPFDFFGREGAEDFAAVVLHPRRNLPVVAISEYENAYLTESLPTDLAADLVGVALVGKLDAVAAQRLTESRGKEWSCFNGAVRLYWPGLVGSDPRRHPLWLRTSLLAQATTARDAASKLRRQLRRQLLGLSAFAVPEPQMLVEVRKAHAQANAERAQRELRDNSDWEGLANLYAEENNRVTSENQSLSERVQDLQAQVTNLQLSLQWKRADSSEIEPDEINQPSTVAEAVDMAKTRFADRLIFGDDVERGISGLAADAGPPEKVLWYLEQLAHMVQVRNGSGLGEAPLKWLQKAGVNASGESETIRNSSEERRRRTWSDGDAQREFDLHLKPTDAAHPDRCVRIYFDFDVERKVAVVGWVGRHP